MTTAEAFFSLDSSIMRIKWRSSDLTLFQSYTLPILHSSNITL